MTAIQNNMAAFNAQKNLATSQTSLGKSLERLSSGYRINSAKDDAAGLAISQSFRADIAADKVALRNTSEANSMLQVAEGAAGQVSNMLDRLKQLATQAASGNVSQSSRDKIDAEAQKVVAEIDRVANSTTYGDTALTDGSFTSQTYQIGAANSADNQLTIDIANMTTGSSGLNITGLDLSSASGATAALDSIKSAIDTVNEDRADIGANMNRLSYAAANLSSTIENLTSAEYHPRRGYGG